MTPDELPLATHRRCTFVASTPYYRVELPREASQPFGNRLLKEFLQKRGRVVPQLAFHASLLLHEARSGELASTATYWRLSPSQAEWTRK